MSNNPAQPTSGLDQPTAQHFEQMLGMITGYWVSQIVRTVADLHIAEHLAEGPLTAEQIAERESSDPANTLRLLRACIALGLVTYADGQFAGTPLLSTLDAGSSHSLRHFALAETSPGLWLSFATMTEAVRKGESQSEAALGMDLFSYYGEHQDEGALFSAAMKDISAPVIAASVAVIDATNVDVAVDVGGATGAFVLALMEANPRLRGVLLDLPHSIAGANSEAAKRGLADRFSAIAGDFFDSVPRGDLFLLKYVIHDWDDETCIRLLKSIRKAMNPGARVIVVDAVLAKLGEPGSVPFASMLDMAMLTMGGGRERELAEFDALFAGAGLRRAKVTPVQAPYALIEAVAV